MRGTSREKHKFNRDINPFRLLISTLTHSKYLAAFTLNPEGNSQIFLLNPFRVGVNQEKISNTDVNLLK
jgi:hypothetical protein